MEPCVNGLPVQCASLEQPSTLTIHRGLGGDYIVIQPVQTVFELLNAVELRTDWLWGYGRPHAFRDSQSGEFLPWDHDLFLLTDMDSKELLSINSNLSITSSTRIQIVFLPLRITQKGFPCFNCMEFENWDDTCWYTRYRLKSPEYFIASGRDRMNPFVFGTDFVRCLIHPRDYYCVDCGPYIVDEYRDHLEMVRWNSATSRLDVSNASRR